jgi:ribosomal protein L10
LDSFQFETVQERYEKLANDIPQIIFRVPSIYIASYLGVTPETLSRVRAKSNLRG